MKPLQQLTLLAALALWPSLGFSETSMFPRVDTANLNGTEVSLPDQLPADPTLVLVAFKQRQQDNLNVWIEKMDLTGPNAPAWVELPVIANYGSLWRGFIDNGMRSGITETEDRARVFTIYVDPKRFRSFFEMPTDEEIYLMVVERDGTVRETVQGDYSREKEERIRAALR